MSHPLHPILGLIISSIMGISSPDAAIHSEKTVTVSSKEGKGEDKAHTDDEQKTDKSKKGKDGKRKNKQWGMSAEDKEKAIDECGTTIKSLEGEKDKLSGDVQKRFERHLAFANAELDYMKGVTDSAIKRSAKSCRTNTKYANDILKKNTAHSGAKQRNKK